MEIENQPYYILKVSNEELATIRVAMIPLITDMANQHRATAKSIYDTIVLTELAG